MKRTQLLLGQVPFYLGGAPKDFQKVGRGVARIGLAMTANTDTTITHNLGRIPTHVKFFCYVDPGSNPPSSAVFEPKLKPSTVTAWTKTQVTVQSDTTITAAEKLWMWIV